MRALAMLLAMVFLLPALPAAGPESPLATLKARLQRDLPADDWSFLSDAAAPLATWDLPPGAIGLTVDTRTLLAGPPRAMHDGEDAGCTDYGGAFAVWEPSPPGIYPTCTGDIVHDGAITSITLICAGVTPTFGCAHVGIELDRRVYFLFLCAYPEGPLVGIEWPEQDLHVNCALHGDDPTTWQRWSVTLSANGPLLTHGALAH